MIKKITIIILYIVGIVLGITSIFLHNEYAYRDGTGFNFRDFTIFGVPFIYIGISAIFDLFIYRNNINRITKTVAISFLPIFISLFFITLSWGYLPNFSFRNIFWYFKLILPIVVAGVFIYRVYKTYSNKIKLLMIFKYGVSFGLYMYCLIIYFVLLFYELVSG